jgi:hypothetical protein
MHSVISLTKLGLTPASRAKPGPGAGGIPAGDFPSRSPGRRANIALERTI